MSQVFSVIVVGTDGSETAGEAVALAVELARQNHAKLHLVVGVQALPRSPCPPAGPVSPIPPAGPDCAMPHSACWRTWPRVSTDLDVEIHTESAVPADVIVRVADEVGADLIVVGSKGMRGTRRILGSVPNSVAHKAGCHVLVAKTT